MERTPYAHKVRYGITGAPILTEDQMDGSHAPGVGISPTLIELAYIPARDDKPARIDASVTGWWTRFGKLDEFGGQMTTHFKNGPDGWPAWLAEEARLHDPDAVPSVPATQAADRAALSAKLWEIAEHRIIAEWVCCEPIDPKHELCTKGQAALGMVRALLVDSPEAWNPEAPLLNAVLAETEQVRRERDLAIAHDRQPYPTAWAYEQACKAREKHRERADAAEEHRLALSEALGLGTGAPWDAIRDRAAEVTGAALRGMAAMRVDVLREAADICDEAGALYTGKALNDQADGAFRLMERFLRKANEAEYVATPCDLVACEPGGEPCSTHERLMAHGEGEHELCEPDCGTTAAGLPQAEAPADPWSISYHRLGPAACHTPAVVAQPEEA